MELVGLETRWHVRHYKVERFVEASGALFEGKRAAPIRHCKLDKTSGEKNHVMRNLCYTG